MPKDFTDCIKEGGRVRTKELSEDRYMHICFKDGKSYAGEVKEKKSHGTLKDAMNHLKSRR